LLSDKEEYNTLHLAGLPKDLKLEELRLFVESKGFKCENISILNETSAKLKF